MDTSGWTLDELAQRAGEALAADAVRAPNGRVRDRPDGRAIRWYATIGLVDRPLTGPGRAARYGSRHLLQVVAVKRLQAQGRSLAQIQAELTGATDATLRRIADLPQNLAGPAEGTGPEVVADAPITPTRFWAATPTRSEVQPDAVTGPAASPPSQPQVNDSPAETNISAAPFVATSPSTPSSVDSPARSRPDTAVPLAGSASTRRERAASHAEASIAASPSAADSPARSRPDTAVPLVASAPTRPEPADSPAEANIAAAGSAASTFARPGSKTSPSGSSIAGPIAGPISGPLAASLHAPPGHATPAPSGANIESALAISAPDPLGLAPPPADRSRAAAFLADSVSADSAFAPARESAVVAEPAPNGGFTTVRYEIALTDAVRLTVPFLPDTADLEAIREAAAPLLQLLAARSLTTLQGAHDEY